MSDPVQITARGPRADAEAAAAAIDADALLESATYSILEEDEDRGVWRIDGFPVSDEEADALRAVLAGYRELSVSVDAVKTTMRALFDVFGIADLPQNEKRAALAAQALRSGAVTRRDLAAGPP